jgi:alkanesulfonate monooxygenase SsuD/methylene tetrahydromethanopterin reductase-like flavin-dependent oxidoreductase (luciferase family)
MEFGSFMEFQTRPGASHVQAFEESFRHIEEAEDWGLHGVWLAESHFNPDRMVLSAPLIIASAIAARTRRLKIGTAVHLIPLGNPLKIAEEIATLDNIAHGRFEFGIGRSGMPGSYEGYNIPYSESRERFFEALEIILQAFTQDRFSYHGRWHSFDNVRLSPRPYTQPHPFIRIAATTEESFPRLGQMGMPVFVGLRSNSTAQVGRQVELYRDAWGEGGHDKAFDVSLRLQVYVADTEQAALSEPEESFMSQFRRLGSAYAASAATVPGQERLERAETLSSLSWEQVQADRAAVGTPDMVIERLRHLQEELCLSTVLAEFNAGGRLPPEKVSRSLELFCKEVMPAFE